MAGPIRTALRSALAKSFPTWVYPGPVTSQGITTQDSGWLPWNAPLNYWQAGHRHEHYAESAAVEACVSVYSQTVAMLPGAHWRKLGNGGRELVSGSPLAHILHKPNPYQTRSDFLLNQVRALLYRGNAYALAEFNNRGERIALHPLLSNAAPYVDPETKAVYYSIAPNDLTPDATDWPLDMARVVPSRYIWHLRLHTPTHPLIGVTPLLAAMFAIGAQHAIGTQQANFFSNMSRPSGTLNTDMVLTPSQVAELRLRWQEQSAGINIGGVPILTAGLKWTPLSMSAADSQLIDYYKLSIADIARVLRVPLALVSDVPTGTVSSTETLYGFFLSSGLGFMLEHIELSLDKFFELPADEYCELDTAALLRSDFKSRMEGIVRGVQGGIYTPNEGRDLEGLARVKAGDEPRMQQQVVPLSWWDTQAQLEREKLQAAAAAPDPDPDPDAEPDPANEKTFADELRAEVIA